MFRGEFKYSMDAKGRISIPAKLRKHVNPEAENTFVMTKSTNKCIDIYPLDNWKVIEEKLEKLNPFVPEQARLIRTMLQYTVDDTLDSQSRILIPTNLIEYAGIEKDVLILGVLKKIEVWNPKIFEDYMNNSDKSFEELAAEVLV